MLGGGVKRGLRNADILKILFLARAGRTRARNTTIVDPCLFGACECLELEHSRSPLPVENPYFFIRGQ